MVSKMDMGCGLLELITQQGRQVITDATATKAERNFQEQFRLSQREVHSRHAS